MKMITGIDGARNVESIEDADNLVRAWEERVAVSGITARGRLRRIGQLKWTSVLKIIRTSN